MSAGGQKGHSNLHGSGVTVRPDDLDPDDIDPDDFEHPLPTLVTFAILSMELHFTTPFSELARNRGFELPQGTENRKRSLDATTMFNKYKLKIPQNSSFYYGIDICVHATHSDGNRSRLNPTALSHDLNFATVGEAVQSAWPESLCDMRMNPECVQHKSETSCATPIVVGIAAFLLQ